MIPRSADTKFAYVHADHEGSIFYVGKGSHARMMSVTSPRNQKYKDQAALIGAENVLIGGLECSNEHTAYMLERGLISCLNRMGAKLTNLTSGGSLGTEYVQESKDKMSASMIGRRLTEERKKAISSQQAGKPKPRQSETLKRMIAAGEFSPPTNGNTGFGAANACSVRVTLTRNGRIEVFDNQRMAAEFLGVSQTAVSSAKKKGFLCKGWAVHGD
jgi:hypothetical protein